MARPRIKMCLILGIMGFCISPYLSNLLPGGGESAQWWLDREIAYITLCIETCDDPEMKEVFAYTVRKYHRVGIFRVRVLQLPDYIHGYNHPFCPGITIDEEVPHLGLKYGAKVLVHEAMHDYFPYFGHFHIDDKQILRSL